jgi:aminoglycoside phosphotransferase (APT) family kinase protein
VPVEENPVTTFNPDDHRAQIEHYLGRSLGDHVRLVCAKELVRSTREAPWRLDVEVGSQARSFVLRPESQRIEHEYRVLRALESLPIPAPRAYGWDPAGEALGMPCFFYDLVEGESLLHHMLASEPWAEELYIDTVCALQSITRDRMSAAADFFEEGETAADVLEDAYSQFQASPDPLADRAYARLRETLPALPEPRFSNGDLWPDNLIVRDRQLTGVIDWANAGFSDPIFEFLLPFFLRPALRGRGIEERYCRRMGFDPGLLPWYHGLEFFDSWRWVRVTGTPYEQHTEESLRADLARWLRSE